MVGVAAFHPLAVGVVEPVAIAVGSISWGNDKAVYREDQRKEMEWGIKVTNACVPSVKYMVLIKREGEYPTPYTAVQTRCG